MRAYEYRHIVSFEETNMVGNVYYANHVRWQGRCREMFLRDQVPDVLQALENGLVLVTTKVACEYYQELFAFDEVLIRMTVADVTQSRVTMRYDYLRGASLVARGEQQIACLQKHGEQMIPAPVPQALLSTLAKFAEPGTIVS